MKVKTATLIGEALDWAVANCENVKLLDPNNNKWESCWTLLGDDSGDYYSPSTNWGQGGLIIEREGISIYPINKNWWATHRNGNKLTHKGDTPLIAAMRCYVTSKLGEEVEIPDELLKT